MSVVVTLDATPPTQDFGSPIAFSGAVLEDGLPVDGLTVNIRTVQGDVFLIGAQTDINGNYYAEWTPDQSWVGTFDIHTLAAMYQGFYSTPVTLTVLGPGVEVRFFIYDEVTPGPVSNVLVTMDGVQVYTDANGLAIFPDATQGLHTFSVSVPGYDLVEAYDVFGNLYGLSGMFTIVWKPTGEPYPTDQPWPMEFHLTPSGVEPPPPPPPGIGGLWPLLFVAAGVYFFGRGGKKAVESVVP